MLESITFKADDAVAFRLDGRLSDSEFDRVVALLDEKITAHGKVKMYAEIESFGGMSLKTFFKDLRYGLTHVRYFSKAAVVTDKTWIRTVTEIEDKLFPSLDMKAFPFEERDRARNWLLD